MKRIHIICLMPLLLLLLAGCEKEGEMVVTPIRAFKPFEMLSGFVLGDTLEQYFDGIKVRDIYGPTVRADEIAFEKNDIINMELRKKSSGEIVYTQNFNISDATNTVPKFYFDGTKILSSYDYPAPAGAIYKANFYFDFPKGSGAVDVTAEILEYYLDRSTGKYVNVVLNVTRIPVATAVEPGKWSGYVALNVLPVLVKSRSDAKFSTYICIKQAGTAKYYINDHIADVITKMSHNSFSLKFPVASTTIGLTQSFFVGMTTQNATVILQPKQDLVQLFPK